MLLLLLFILCSGSLAVCPDGAYYDQGTNKCFQINPVGRYNSYAAEATCAKLGGFLASIGNGFQNSAILIIPGEIFWIGASYWGKADKWAWDDESPFSYANWAPGYPLTPQTDEYIVFSTIDGKWRNGVNDSDNYFLCELPQINTTLAPYPQPATHCDHYWEYHAPTNSCYYCLTQFEQENYCLQSGAHLASIHTDKENHFIYQYSRKGNNIIYNLCNHCSGGGLLIGLRNDGTNYEWTDGTSLDYTNFGSGDNTHDGTNQTVYMHVKTGSNSQKWLQYETFFTGCAICKKKAYY